MFKRVFVEDWAQLIPIISFCIFAAVFLLVTLRALCLRKSERERMAQLPLDDRKPSNSNLTSKSS
ncbi:MAG: hypothetical protein R3242_08405 [Akkermansiaceae bacterium]|nr:hypothetical protein [Akkermansiaceae bacterium]